MGNTEDCKGRSSFSVVYYKSKKIRVRSEYDHQSDCKAVTLCNSSCSQLGIKKNTDTQVPYLKVPVLNRLSGRPPFFGTYRFMRHRPLSACHCCLHCAYRYSIRRQPAQHSSRMRRIEDRKETTEALVLVAAR